MTSLPSHLGWIAAALLLLIAGLLLGNLLLLSGAVFILVTALLSTMLAPPNAVVVTRSLPTSTCWVGDKLTVERRLSAHGGIGAVFVHDEIPPEAQVVSGSNLRVLWKWPGVHAADLSYQVKFPRRGSFTLEPSRWESRAPFGVNRSARGASDEAFSVSVVPRIRSLARLNALRAPTRSGRDNERANKLSTTSDEFRGLRPHLPGDPLNLINWKATARGLRADNLPIVNEMYPEAQMGVWIFLDTGEYMDVGLPLSNSLEHTIEASGALAQYYLARGSTLGAYAYNSVERGSGLLTPESGKNQFNRLLQMLAGLKPGPPQEDLLQAVERCKGFLNRLQPAVFVITRLDAQYDRPGEMSNSFSRFKSAITSLSSLGVVTNRGRQVNVVHVAPRASVQASQRSEWSSWESSVIARQVREAGARVIEWEPGREEFASVLLRHAQTDL